MYYVPVTDYKLQELTFNDYKLQELTFKCLNLYFVRVIRTLKEGIEGSQMLFYVWFEFTSWLRGVGQGKGAWDCFLTIWAWDSCAFCQWDQGVRLLRDSTFVRFIGPREGSCN